MQTQMYLEAKRQQTASSKFYSFASNIVGMSRLMLVKRIGLPKTAVRDTSRMHEKCQITNENGMVTFQNVPINNYVIRVAESKRYLSAEKRLDLVSERTVQPTFDVFIELKPQTASFVEVRVLDQQGLRIEDANVTALLLEPEESIVPDRILCTRSHRIPVWTVSR